jgi:predicted dehydrogenase
METVRFSVVGINHSHIFGQVNALLRGGAEFISYYAAEGDLIEGFARAFPQAARVSSMAAILEDESIHLVASAAIPDQRASIGILAMRHGKDFMSDKPGFITLEQLEQARQVQAETGRIYSICYSERFESRATVKAAELVTAGAIGRVIQTIGLGPHRANLAQRPAWFFQRARYGGILTDIASHQVDQFLFFTGSKSAEVVAAEVGNYNHPEYPELEDFGEMLLRSDVSSGYIRVDWFTPDGLPTWGDGRLFLLGTDGYIEIRKYCDIGGRPGGDHLFLVDRQGVHTIDCARVELPDGPLLVQDVLNRTETAMSQAHCFLASEVAIRAQAAAQRIKL